VVTSDEPQTTGLPPFLVAFGARVDEFLFGFLAERRERLAGFDPAAAVLIDELARLLRAGGKRVRPAFCYLGHRAAGGEDGEPIERAAAALELLHTFALVHDDVMDDATERRGVPTTQVRFAAELGWSSPAHGRSVAVLVGDLAAVLAESLLRSADFPRHRLDAALDRFDRMRVEMAAGQYLDLLGAARRDLPTAEHVAELKTGSYTVEGPLLIGAALAGASGSLEGRLRAYGRPLGEAFQLRDDVLDHEAIPGAVERVDALVGEALAALDRAGLDPTVSSALGDLAAAFRPSGT
jgi:geranylgeranyl diphosphate synthase type I